MRTETVCEESPVTLPRSAPASRPPADDRADRFPRVAILASGPLRTDTGNGILMRSLFAGWPQDRLAQIYLRFLVNHLPQGGVCSEFRVIGASGRARRVAVTASGEARALPATAGGADGAGTGVPRPRQAPSRRWRQLSPALATRPRLASWLKLLMETWYGGPWVARALRRQLRALRPDIVYALLGRYHTTKLAAAACRELGIPLFVHVADDFVPALYREYPLGARLQRASAEWFERSLAHATGRAAIGPAMAEDFAARYGGTWNWFTTLVDSAAYDPAPRQGTGRIELVFAGSLALGRWQPLRELGLALAEGRRDGGAAAGLTIYAQPELLAAHRAALDIPGVKLAGWVPASELPEIFHRADALVHVESSDRAHADYTRLALSTKISQYMMSGRCIVAIGPADQGSVRIVREAGAGVAIEDPRSTPARALLEGVLGSEAERREYGRRGREWALRWVAGDSGRERFRAALREALRARQEPA